MHRSLAIFVALALSAVTGAALPWSSTTVNADPPEPGPILVTVNFPGGTVADYVQALKKAAGGVNIVAAIETKDVQMPAVDLTNASLAGALGVLNGRTAQTADRYIKLAVHENFGGSSEEKMVYAIDAAVQGRAVDDRIMQRVWSVKNILENGTQPNDLLTAVQTSLDLLSNPGKPAQLKFHEATGLIIVRASPDQIDAIQQVIEQMAPPPQMSPRNPLTQKNQALELELQKAQLEIDNCRAQNKRLEAELAEAKKR